MTLAGEWVLDLGNSVSMAAKKFLAGVIHKKGGTVSAIVTKRTTFLVVTKNQLATPDIKIRTALSYGVQVVTPEYVKCCVIQGRCLDSWPYRYLGTQVATTFAPSEESLVCNSVCQFGRAMWGLAGTTFTSVPLTRVRQAICQLHNLCRGLLPRNTEPAVVCSSFSSILKQVLGSTEPRTKLRSVSRTRVTTSTVTRSSRIGSGAYKASATRASAASTSKPKRTVALGSLVKERETKRLQKQAQLQAERQQLLASSTAKRTNEPTEILHKRIAEQKEALHSARQQVISARKSEIQRRQKEQAAARRVHQKELKQQKEQTERSRNEFKESLLQYRKATTIASQKRNQLLEDIEQAHKRTRQELEELELKRIRAEEAKKEAELQARQAAKLAKIAAAETKRQKEREQKAIEKAKRKEEYEIRKREEELRKQMEEAAEKEKKKAAYMLRKLKKERRANSGLPPPPLPLPAVNSRKVFVGHIVFDDIKKKKDIEEEDKRILKQQRIDNLLNIFRSFGEFTQVDGKWDEGCAFLVYKSVTAAGSCLNTLVEFEERKSRCDQLLEEMKEAGRHELCVPKSNFYVRKPKETLKSKAAGRAVNDFIKRAKTKPTVPVTHFKAKNPKSCAIQLDPAIPSRVTKAMSSCPVHDWSATGIMKPDAVPLKQQQVLDKIQSKKDKEMEVKAAKVAAKVASQASTSWHH
ncbi:hypothetical protein Pelo_13461 [Pelomyxa schiedti]|nr:hypothetical protein Pelo_13461 [Pelomyxa schiedti]